MRCGGKLVICALDVALRDHFVDAIRRFTKGFVSVSSNFDTARSGAAGDRLCLTRNMGSPKRTTGNSRTPYECLLLLKTESLPLAQIDGKSHESHVSPIDRPPVGSRQALTFDCDDRFSLGTGFEIDKPS